MMTSIDIIIILLISLRLSFAQLSLNNNNSINNIINNNNNNLNILIPTGYWRFNEGSTLYYRCPYGTSSCIGGDEVGEEACLNGFIGLLCSQCEYGTTINLITLKCENNLLNNNKDNNITIWKYIEIFINNFLLILPFGIFFPLWICCCTSEKEECNINKIKIKQKNIFSNGKNTFKDIQLLTKETIELSSDDDSISSLSSSPSSLSPPPSSSASSSIYSLSPTDIELGSSYTFNNNDNEIKKNLFLSNNELDNNANLIAQNKFKMHNKIIMNIIMRIKIILSSMQISSCIARITGVSFHGSIVTTILRIYR
jgi:hypothetical protein